MGTKQDYGNMLKQKYVKTESPPKKKPKGKFSAWSKLGAKK